MKAVRFHGANEALTFEELPTPEPKAGEVLVQVHACGICASDLHMFDGSLPIRTPPPVTPGHEAAGVIAELGVGVAGYAIGDRVTMYAGKSCGVCRRCQAGEPVERCALPITMGIDYDGAWAEYVAVPAAGVVKVPDSVPFEIAAILADCVATPFNAVLDTGGLKPGQKAAIFGVGGLGTHGVMLARLGGASFIAAIDPNPAARDRAKRLGADLVIDPNEVRPSQAIREATGGEGVDLAIDFVGRNAVLKEAVASLAIDGRAVIVGVSAEKVTLGPSVTFAAFRSTLRGVMGYTRAHLETLVELVASGRLDLTASVSARLPLARYDEGLRMVSDTHRDAVRVLLLCTETSSV